MLVHKVFGIKAGRSRRVCRRIHKLKVGRRASPMDNRTMLIGLRIPRPVMTENSYDSSARQVVIISKPI